MTQWPRAGTAKDLSWTPSTVSEGLPLPDCDSRSKSEDSLLTSPCIYTHHTHTHTPHTTLHQCTQNTLEKEEE